jgi:DNA repair protein RAD50
MLLQARYISYTDISMLLITNTQTFSITSRCADMDAELPLHLGVPKAILDNVIFCHQEESNWPLSEPSILKKKFDDIFSSKRYQVALENIKDIRKESTQEIRVNTVRLEALKADAAKAKKVRSTLTQMNQQLMAKTETLQTIESKIERVDQDSQRLIEALRSVELTADQIQQIINKKDFYTSTMQSIESHITPRSESTEQLIELLRQHHIKEGKNQEEKSTIAQEKSQLERRLKQVQEALSQKHLVMGRLEAAREEHERQIQARSTLIKKINDTQDLDLPVEDGSASATVLKRLLQERAVKNEKEKDNAMARQNELSDELQLLKSRALSIRENKKHLNKLIVSWTHKRASQGLTYFMHRNKIRLRLKESIEV